MRSRRWTAAPIPKPQQTIVARGPLARPARVTTAPFTGMVTPSRSAQATPPEDNAWNRFIRAVSR